MKFLGDMGVSQSTILWIRSEGHDATHLREQGLQRAPDTAIVEKGIREKRVILTFDLDFGAIMAASGEETPSIIIFRLENERPDNVNQRLEQVLNESTQALEQGAIIVVEETRHRVRLLPI